MNYQDTDDILITSGSQQVMAFATQCLCNEGDYVICENPSFLGAINAFKAAGAKVKGIDFKDGQMDLEALEEVLQTYKNVRFIYVIPDFQNPTGYTMSLNTRQELLNLAKKYHVLILEDNPYGELIFNGEHIPSIKSLDQDGYVIYAASLSKIVAPGMRVAACIGAKEIIKKFVVSKQTSDVHTNIWAQKVMAHYLKEYDVFEHLKQIRALYKEKCDYMLKCMDQCFPSNVHYTRPNGGMFIWVTLPNEVDMNAFVNEALNRFVAVVPGQAFYDDDTKECHSFRMNYSMASLEQIEHGVSILGKLMDEWIKKD